MDEDERLRDLKAGYARARAERDEWKAAAERAEAAIVQARATARRDALREAAQIPDLGFLGTTAGDAVRSLIDKPEGRGVYV